MHVLQSSFTKSIGQWFASDDCGASSEAMACIALGATEGYFYPPVDGSDFGRCYRLVFLVPQIKLFFPDIAKACPDFIPVLDNWDELCKLYEKGRCGAERTELDKMVRSLVKW